MKKLGKLVLSFLMVASLAACSSSSDDLTYKAGTYSSTVKGHNGDLTVEVIVSETNIDSVKVTSHDETLGLSDAAINDIPQIIVDHQSLAVDTMAGATITSKAVLEATEKALEQADANIKALKAKEIAEAKGEKVTKDTDVLVIGAGIAGLAAAVEAAEAGADVILIEKMPVLGGSTARSGGKIQAANTSLQQAAGIEDSWEAFADYLYEVSHYQADKAFLDKVAMESAENIEWLIERGVVFDEEIIPVHPTITPYRIHNPVEHIGAGFTYPLEAKLKEYGVEILVNTTAESFITDNNGVVVGAKATNNNNDDITFNAASVVLATGGFDKNEDLVAEMLPEYVGGMTNVSEGNTGDGINMVKEVGANILKSTAAVALVFDLSASQLLGYDEQFDYSGLFVNTDGERFMDESEFMFKRTRRVLNSNGVPELYYILDESDYKPGFDYAIDAGRMFKADTIEELAEMINIDADVLLATVKRYNDLAATGTDSDYNKRSDYMRTISETGPYYASHFTLITSGTFGGPEINLEAEVISTEGAVIEGLYAAGEVASAQFFSEEYPGSGSAISCFLTFGREAGRNAAARALAK